MGVYLWLAWRLCRVAHGNAEWSLVSMIIFITPDDFNYINATDTTIPKDVKMWRQHALWWVPFLPTRVNQVTAGEPMNSISRRLPCCAPLTAVVVLFIYL